MVVSARQHVGYQMQREQDRLFWMRKSIRNIINYNTMLCSIIGSILSDILEPFHVNHSFFFRTEQMLALESRGKI